MCIKIKVVFLTLQKIQAKFPYTCKNFAALVCSNWLSPNNPVLAPGASSGEQKTAFLIASYLPASRYSSMMNTIILKSLWSKCLAIWSTRLDACSVNELPFSRRIASDMVLTS